MIEILEICRQVSSEEITQKDELTKKDRQVKTQNAESYNITEHSKITTATKLVQEERNKMKMIKKIMTEKKKVLLLLMNQDWKKKVKLKMEKVNKLLKHILTDNVTELNYLFYAKAKVVTNKLDILIRNPKKDREGVLMA